ncbi:MAG: sensor histidine kinase [Helicobacteraceae bacterium]|jgi:signal transduction histidine kinase|nr:sensor histidine kinase [Helicobacteraceae bacterium]
MRFITEGAALSIATILTPERKHSLRWLGESFFLGAVLFVFWALLFMQERDKLYSAQDRLLSVYAIYTELMFADIDDMIYRVSKPYFNSDSLKTSVLEEMWRGRQNEDPLLHNVLLLDKDKNILFMTRETDANAAAALLQTYDFDGLPVSPRGVQVIEPFLSSEGDEWLIAFSRVFYDDAGKPSGYAIAAFKLSVVAQRYNQLTETEDNVVALLSVDGKIIAKTPQKSSEQYFGRVFPAYKDFTEHNTGYDKRLVTTLQEGEKALASFAPIKAYNMIVAVAAPYSSIYSRIRVISGAFTVAWLALSFACWKLSRHSFLDEQMRALVERETRLKLESKAEEALIKQLEAEQSKREHEKILIQQSKMAAMGEMVAAIAHQWRQPLNSIGLYVQDILDAQKFGQLNEEYIRNAVDKTMWQLRFMSSTINDFSNFFKPDKAKATFDLSKVVQNSIGLIAAQLKSHDIDFSFEIPSEPLWCDGYENELGQAALNLINNAKDAIVERRPRGKKRKIVVRLTRSDRKARLEVEDNGGGVPNHIMDRIFEPYFTTKDSDKGTGIGLYMSKMIVEDNMGGKIGVYNVEKGACFFIILPLAKEGLR